VRKAVLLAAVLVAATAALVARSGSTTSTAAATAAPTYYRDVAPILDAKCASCHRLGGIAPFALTTSTDAKAHADGIVRMTKAGLMPPWMPGDDSAAIIGRDKRRLTTTELSTLARWTTAGAPAGNPATRHSKPSLGAGLSGPGQTITLMPPKAYSPHAAGGGIDDYHCFLLDPKLKQDAFVTAALIRPQRTGIVHHVILYEAAGTQTAAAMELNAEHGGQGWSCFGGPNLPIDAEEARTHGFVASVHPPAELAAAAVELAERIARMPSGALRRAKLLLQASLSHNAEEQVAMEVGFILESFATGDFREGVTSFVEKRKPDFAAERQ